MPSTPSPAELSLEKLHSHISSHILPRSVEQLKSICSSVWWSWNPPKNQSALVLQNETATISITPPSPKTPPLGNIICLNHYPARPVRNEFSEKPRHPHNAICQGCIYLLYFGPLGGISYGKCYISSQKPINLRCIIQLLHRHGDDGWSTAGRSSSSPPRTPLANIENLIQFKFRISARANLLPKQGDEEEKIDWKANNAPTPVGRRHNQTHIIW